MAEARLQDRITGPHRATITSVAGLGIELAALLVFAAWAVGGPVAVAVLVLAVVPVARRGAAGPDGAQAQAGEPDDRPGARAGRPTASCPTTARKSRLKCAWSNQPRSAASAARSSTSPASMAAAASCSR